MIYGYKTFVGLLKIIKQFKLTFLSVITLLLLNLFSSVFSQSSVNPGGFSENTSDLSVNKKVVLRLLNHASRKHLLE